MAVRKADSKPALPDDFRDFIACINTHQVDFVLVGGYALAVHGFVRATGDIDFFYRRSKRNVEKLCNAMGDFGAPPEVIDPEALLTPETVTQFGRPPHRIDLLNEIDGVSFSEVWKKSEHANIGGVTIRVIGMNELRKNKLASGRKQDVVDVDRLSPKQNRKRSQ